MSLNEVEIRSTQSNLEIPVKVLHISDLHGKLFSTKQRKLTLMMDRLDYDVVVMTGDMIDKKTDDFMPVEFLLQYFQERGKPTFFITGNHEGANPLYPEFQNLIEEYGVTTLDNQKYTLNLENGQSVSFVGLSDPNIVSFQESQPIVDELLSEAGEQTDTTILLSHRPTFMPHFTGKTDVILSGHSHGGQIRLPFIGGLISPGEGWFPKYDYGVFEETFVENNRQTVMYVTKGMGNSIIPIRLFNSPEVAFLTIY